MSLRTVLVGAASRVAGPCHRIALARCPKIDVVGYMDVDTALLTEVGAEDGVTKLFREFDEVLADDVRLPSPHPILTQTHSLSGRSKARRTPAARGSCWHAAP